MGDSERFNKWLAGLLARQKILPTDQVEAALAAAREGGLTFAAYAIQQKLVDERQMIGLMSRETGIAPIDLEKVSPSEDLAETLGQDLARNYGIVPVSRLENLLTIAVSDPLDVLKLDDVRIITNSELRPVLSTEPRIKDAIDRLYNRRKAEMEALLAQDPGADMTLVKESDEKDDLAELAAIQSGDEGSPVVKFVNLLILEAIQRRASDIHVEPMESRMRMRYRIDGILQDVHTVSKNMQSGIVSRIKVIAEMDIAERGRPQDGMFQMKVDKRKVDFRVSVVPIVHGEKVVIRILDGSQLVMSLEGLGFEPRSLEDYRWAIRQPYGMILASGPSGSGKTTTLYSGLMEIMNPEENVITVEDPVEYQMEGVNQVQVNLKGGLTFAAALRSILRQDPNKIMIGEIRDNETIEIALRAALTGHLVLSTIHANDAAQAVTRILNMGVDHFLVASTGLIFTAQRLARRLCPECRVPVKVAPQELIALQFRPEEAESASPFAARPEGCAHCYRGYKGRVAIIESLRFTESLRRSVVGGANSLEIKRVGLREGMVSLRRSGVGKVLQGITSVEEMKRVTMED